MVASNDSPSPKLDELRTLLSKAQDGEGVAAFIIPTEDAHMVSGEGWCVLSSRAPGVQASTGG